MEKLSVCGNFLLSKPVVFRLVDHRPASTVTAAGTNGGVSYSVYSGSGARLNGTASLESNPAEIEVGDRWYLVQVSPLGDSSTAHNAPRGCFPLTAIWTIGHSRDHRSSSLLRSFDCDLLSRVTEGTEGKWWVSVGNRERGMEDKKWAGEGIMEWEGREGE
jgi:hypothetical protein